MSIRQLPINVYNRSIVKEVTRPLQTGHTRKSDKAATARRQISWKCLTLVMTDMPQSQANTSPKKKSRNSLKMAWSKQMSLETFLKNWSITSATTMHWRTFQSDHSLSFSWLRKKKTYTYIQIFWMRWLHCSSQTTRWKMFNSSSKLGDKLLKKSKGMLMRRLKWLEPQKIKSLRNLLNNLKLIQN